VKDRFILKLLFSYSSLGYLFYDRVRNFLFINKFNNSLILEIVWAIFPTIIIINILIPSLYLLYSLDEDINPLLNLKAIGHQWFWSYELVHYFSSNALTASFDSVMIQEEDLFIGSKRLLEVDNRIFLPINTPFRVLVTSSDVLHSWALPELGIKMDAVPGRLNQIIGFIVRPGVFFGQCSELCGVNHGFMPIVIEGVSWEQFLKVYE